MRGELSKDIVPELRRIRRVVNDRREAVKQQRAALAQVKVDPTDLASRFSDRRCEPTCAARAT